MQVAPAPAPTAASAAVGCSKALPPRKAEPTPHPLDLVQHLLYSSPPDVPAAGQVLKGYIRQTPYSHAWQLFIAAHEWGSELPLPDRVHTEWLKTVGMDCAAARLYLTAARHISAPHRVAAAAGGPNSSVAERTAVLSKAKSLLEFALVTPMDELEEVAKAYEPIAAAVSEGAAAARGGAVTIMTPQLKRRYEAATAIFEYEGAWPERHHDGTDSDHVRRWSATMQRLFSTYVCLATAKDPTTPAPKPFPSTVEHHVRGLTAEEAAQLRNTQLQRIRLAMRQALEQCPNEEVLLIHYCAFVAAVTNSTEDAKAALTAHLAAAGTSNKVFSPAMAALNVALTRIDSPADLFQLLTAATTTSATRIAQANNCLDLGVLSTLKRFREIGKEATEAANETNRWHMFSEWLEVECNSIGNRTFAAKIAEKGYDKLHAEALGFGRAEVDGLALFARRAYQMHMAHGTPEEGQLIAEKLIGHLSTLTEETVIAGSSAGGQSEMETGRQLASAPVNTLKEACSLMGVGADDTRVQQYINGRRVAHVGANSMQLAIDHSVGHALPLLTADEAKWATVTHDFREAGKRFDGDGGYGVANELKRRFHRLGQAMPWGLATVDDTISSDPLELAMAPDDGRTDDTAGGPSPSGEVNAPSASGWKPFVPPVNTVRNINVESDEIRAPFAMRGTIASELVIDGRTLLRQQREEAYRVAEGRKKTSDYDQLPSLLAKLLKRLPLSAEGCTSIANVEPQWLVRAIAAAPLNLGELVEVAKQIQQ